VVLVSLTGESGVMPREEKKRPPVAMTQREMNDAECRSTTKAFAFLKLSLAFWSSLTSTECEPTYITTYPNEITRVGKKKSTSNNSWYRNYRIIRTKKVFIGAS